jgi:hypothetical protein
VIVKLGSKTLVDVAAGLNWLSKMPPAVISTGRRRQSIDEPRQAV